MEYIFYFESKFRDSGEVNLLKFQTSDGTEFTMSEEWLIAEQRNRRTPMQRLIFRKENNYDRKYLLNIEVSSIINNTSGKIVVSRQSKSIRTSVIILLTDFKRLNYPIREKVTVQGLEIYVRVLNDTFKYKVTITRLHIPQDSKDAEEIHQRDKILVLSDQILSLLETGKFSDVIITNGYSEVRAHCNILCARSKYFYSMFQNVWQEVDEKVAYIQNIDMHTMKEMLRYMYSGVIRPMKFLEMYDLYNAADQFLVEDLTELLSEELVKHLVVENAIEVFRLACIKPDIYLKNKSIEFIRKHFTEVQYTEEWKHLQSDSEGSKILEDIIECVIDEMKKVLDKMEVHFHE